MTLFLALGFIAAAAAVVPPCRDSRITTPLVAAEDGFRRAEYREDVDGDGRPDVLRIEDSSGSGFGLTSAILTLGTGEKLEAEFSYSFSLLLDVIEVPSPLTEPDHRRALELIEEALFGRVCPAPDPSLEWLLGDKRLRWREGPPVMPGTYVVRRHAAGGGQEWLQYAGHNHEYDLGKGPNPVRELARRGERVLLATSHGVILTDPRRSRHAWIYVSTPRHKLRWPSVLAARIVGHEAVVTLSVGDGYLRETATQTARIDLRTGAVREAPIPPR